MCLTDKCQKETGEEKYISTILNHSTRQSWVASFMCPWNQTLVLKESHSQSGPCGEEKIPVPTLNYTLAIQPIAHHYTTELF
jgi:hypothetical protein